MNTANKELRRVRRVDVQVSTYIKPDGLEYCLACWKDWMTGDADSDLGIKTMRGLAGEDSRNVDLSEAQQASDTKIAAATDAMISGLARIHVWAIHRACGITIVWNFPNADVSMVAAEAKTELAKKLKNNICTSVLF